MKLLFILTVAIDINSSEILSDTVDWSDIANIFSWLIPFAIFSIITSFCARIYSKRRVTRKTEQLIEELKNETNRNSSN